MSVPYSKSISVVETESSYIDLILKQKHKNLDDRFACTLCSDSFQTNEKSKKLPKCLPCQHTFCIECIEVCLKTSADDHKTFCCPLCKYKMENIKTAQDLQTNRLKINLIERNVNNFHGMAACPDCKQIKLLEVCFDCYKPLCNDCINNHFIEWKSIANNKLEQAEARLYTYYDNMELFKVSVNQNLLKSTNLTSEIEDMYARIIDALNIERSNLIASINEIQKEDEGYLNLKNEILDNMTKLKMLRLNNERYEKKEIESRTKKIDSYLNAYENLELKYNEFARKPLKMIQGLEKSNSLLGELLINNLNVETIIPPFAACTQQTGIPIIPKRATKIENEFPIQSATILRAQSEISFTKPAPDENNEEIIKKWIESSIRSPKLEIHIDQAPNHMASYNNFVFISDDFGTVAVYETCEENICIKQQTHKINFTNIRGLGCNSTYLAFTFSCMSKDDKKKINKKLPTNGIALFRRCGFMICREIDKFIELSKGCFISPAGISLNDTHIYVCDKEQSVVYKLDFNGTVLLSITVDGKPCGVSVNTNYIAITDYTAHELILHDLKLNKSRKKEIEQINKFQNGPFNVVISDDDLCFIRNSTSSEIYLFDRNLEYRATFPSKLSCIYSICVVNMPCKVLIISCRTSNGDYKLLCFSI